MKETEAKIEGNLVDIYNERIFPAEITISNEKIERIKEFPGEKMNSVNYILPGIIDSHIHIESSMLTPAGFAEVAVKHGTVAVVSDPHEIANVAGLEGIQYMIENGETVPLKCFFGAPSCVPATEFESSGAKLGSEEVKTLLLNDRIKFLAEVMNFPAVINKEQDIMKKIDAARELDMPVDGHAPGLRGNEMIRYVQSGISTDHECISLAEAEDKISAGVKIQIREGSAAKNFDVFCELIDKFPDSVMLCSDDMHPDDLIKGHINILLSRGIKKGISLFNLIKAASLNPALHYKLPVGMLREGDFADLIIVKDLEKFKIEKTYINGRLVYSEGNVLFKNKTKDFKKRFRSIHIKPEEINLIAETDKIRVIEVNNGSLYTGSGIREASIQNGYAVADPERDICKIIVCNKYNDSDKPSVGFISGFGLSDGAIAGSVAHDSHNIIAVGINDNEITEAVNTILDMGGGLVAVSAGNKMKLKLEIAGLMTNISGAEVAWKYMEIDNYAKMLGSKLSAPFMSLSFMALLVIPELKIGDRGLFDVNEYSFTTVFVK